MHRTYRFVLVFLLGLSLWLDVAAQTIDRDSLGRPGPYQVAYYSDLPDVPEYSDATIYFPANKAQSFGGVAIAPGFTETQEHIDWWGDYLASHGFAVLVLDTNQPRDDPAMRADALMAAVQIIRGENSRMGSALRGKIEIDRMAVMGHSMGGGGTLLAANAHSDQLKAAIPITPWLPDADFSNVAVPTLLIAGETDSIAKVSEHSWPHFQTLPENIPRIYLEIRDGNHFIANSTVDNERMNPNIDVHDLVGGMSVAWLKLFVDEDERYREIVFGEMPDADAARVSKLDVHQ